MTPPDDYSVTYQQLCARIRNALADVTLTCATRQVGDHFIDPEQIQVRWDDGTTLGATINELIAALPGTRRVGPRAVALGPDWGATTNIVFNRRRTKPSYAIGIINDTFAGRPQRIPETHAEHPSSTLAHIASVLLADTDGWGPNDAPDAETVQYAVTLAEATTGQHRPATYAHIAEPDEVTTEACMTVSMPV